MFIKTMKKDFVADSFTHHSWENTDGLNNSYEGSDDLSAVVTVRVKQNKRYQVFLFVKCSSRNRCVSILLGTSQNAVQSLCGICLLTINLKNGFKAIWQIMVDHLNFDLPSVNILSLLFSSAPF